MAPDPTPAPSTPVPVNASSDLWNLKSDPARLEKLAGSWRTLAAKARSAEGKVNDAAQQVFSKEHWTGKAADGYNEHRKKLTPDIEAFAERATKIASILDYTAGVLRTQQGLLDDERDKLHGVPVTKEADGMTLTFRPKDDAQAKVVSGAINTAGEIRRRVDGILEQKQRDLDEHRREIDNLAVRWKPRVLRMLNLNVGQGAGNTPGNSKGTDGGDMDKIAQLIADQNADVVTLQEVFKGDLHSLEKELEKRTGSEWDVKFGEASRKYQASDDWPILGDKLNQPFGNAVLVRHGDLIDGAGGSETIKLDAPGGTVTIPPGQPGQDPVKIGDEEGRSAIRTRINLKPR